MIPRRSSSRWQAHINDRWRRAGSPRLKLRKKALDHERDPAGGREREGGRMSGDRPSSLIFAPSYLFAPHKLPSIFFARLKITKKKSFFSSLVTCGGRAQARGSFSTPARPRDVNPQSDLARSARYCKCSSVSSSPNLPLPVPVSPRTHERAADSESDVSKQVSTRATSQKTLGE